MKATMSILALYNWDETIFNELQLPDEVERDVLIYNLLFDCGELELLYPDFDSMKNLIGIWSRKELSTWARIVRAAAADYNPIENYNRSETWTENTDGSRSIDNVQNSSGSSSSTNSNTGKVAGYNADTLVIRDGSESDGKIESSGSITDAGTETRKDVVTRSGNVSGNIGVTTSQQMLEQELAISPKLNVYDYIISSFKNRFCLLVY